MLPVDFAASIKGRLTEILKPEQIIDQPERLEEYSKDCSFVRRGSPLLSVFPENREQVQAVVKMAGETRIPLIPISSGPPHFHADTLPSEGGIMVDFSRMKRIIKIDSVSRYAWLEPGVTFGELIPELEKQGLKLDMPLLPRSNKSVVTSRLEREPVTIPKYQYDYVDPLLTLEVVYGTGEDFRTGSASGPGPLDKLKADKVNPWGPGSIDFFRFVSGAQGTLGLVTWAITKVEVLPVIHKLFFIPLEDVKTASGIMNQLLRYRVADECLALNNVNLAAILSENRPGEYLDLKKNLPSWTVLVCLSGYSRRPEERIAVQEKSLNRICEQFNTKPRATLAILEGGEKAILGLLTRPWNKEPYWKFRPKGLCQDLFFLSPPGKTAELINLMNQTSAKHSYPAEDIGVYIQPVVQGRGCHCEFDFFYDGSNAGEAGRVKQFFIAASETLMKNGAFFSRPYGIWAGMVYEKGGEQVAALKKLKSIFDPNNILNPGKLCF